ncbi:hypothetical protein [Gordonia sihwensis]|uniref:hypothetical protein n=1 Tax=Gordonia sihwensis TaxID=173559 RepID=UPI003D9766A4
MAVQWVVTYSEDGTNMVDAVGPFRSKARAWDAMERIESAAEEIGLDWSPQIVQLGSVADAVAKAR